MSVYRSLRLEVVAQECMIGSQDFQCSVIYGHVQKGIRKKFKLSRTKDVKHYNV